MKKLFFTTVEEFVEEVADNYDSIIGEDENISIVAKFEEAREILKELMFLGWNLRDIRLIDNSCGDYDDEYVICLSSIIEDHEIWFEPMKRDGEYITIDGALIYILDNCSSRVISHCHGGVGFDVTISECCEPMCDECCGLCNCDGEELYVDESDDMHGFSVNESDENGYRSYSFYSTDRNLVEEMARLFK